MKLSEILGLIYIGILLVLIVYIFILCVRYDYLFKKRRKEYVEQLNEHDKSVIFDYEKKVFVAFKETLKHEKRK